MLNRLFLFLIAVYRLCISPFLGTCCRFYPSCSEYAQDALKTYPFYKALFLIVKRLLKCGPWHPGGHDPLD